MLTICIIGLFLYSISAVVEYIFFTSNIINVSWGGYRSSCCKRSVSTDSQTLDTSSTYWWIVESPSSSIMEYGHSSLVFPMVSSFSLGFLAAKKYGLWGCTYCEVIGLYFYFYFYLFFQISCYRHMRFWFVLISLQFPYLPYLETTCNYEFFIQRRISATCRGCGEIEKLAPWSLSYFWYG